MNRISPILDMIVHMVKIRNVNMVSYIHTLELMIIIQTKNSVLSLGYELKFIFCEFVSSIIY